MGAQTHPRPHPGDRAFHRRRHGVADLNRARARFRRLVCFGGRRGLGRPCVAARVDPRWRPRPHRLGVPLYAAGIAALSGDPWPRRRGDQDSQSPRHCRPDRTAVDRCRQQHQERSVRRRVQDVPEARHRRHDLLHGVLRHRHRPWRLAAEHHERQGLHHHQVAAIYAGDELRGAVRLDLHDVRARQIRPQDHGDLHLHRRRPDGDRVRQRRDRDRADHSRLYHDLLRPGRRQFDADLHVRSGPDQRARVGLRLGVGRRAAGDRGYHADDLVDSDRLWAGHGVRLPGGALVHRRNRGDAARPRSAAEEPRRDRAADRMTTRIAWLLTAVFCFAAAAPPAAQTSGAGNWLTYQNDRYGTTIEYPGFFKPEPPPDNDDGRRFKSADGAEFAVFASYNALDFDIAGYLQDTLKNLDPGATVTYQAHADDWFVISGTKGDGIFYQRRLLSHGKEMTEGFVMSYPARIKQLYDPIVARMAKSFRSGPGFQTPGADVRKER